MKKTTMVIAMPALAPPDCPLEPDEPPPFPVGVELELDCVRELEVMVVTEPVVVEPRRDRSLLSHITIMACASIAFDEASVVVE